MHRSPVTSRTAALVGEFGPALATADHVIVTAIYAARERDTLGMSGQAIVDRIPPGHPDARYMETLERAKETLLQEVRPGDLVITLGAGDAYLVGDQLLVELGNREVVP